MFKIAIYGYNRQLLPQDHLESQASTDLWLRGHIKSIEKIVRTCCFLLKLDLPLVIYYESTNLNKCVTCLLSFIGEAKVKETAETLTLLRFFQPNVISRLHVYTRMAKYTASVYDLKAG